MSAALTAALAYAGRGWAVFPARVTIIDGRKHVAPLGLWRQVSTTDMLAVTRWWGDGGECPDASVCIDTGKSGLVVVDPDGAVGIAAWGALVAEHALAATYRARTPGGGEHWYYAADLAHVVGNDSSGKVAAHVDVRGLGGFVIAPPSVDDRGAYGWIEGEPDGQLPAVPALVRERMGAKAAAEILASAPAGGVGLGEFGLAPRLFTLAQAFEFCRDSMDALAGARDGTINDRLNQAAKTLSHFVDVPGFWSRSQATGWLLQALESTVYDGATWVAENTIDSAFRSAAGDWRAALDEGEVPGPLAGPSQFPGGDGVYGIAARNGWIPVDLTDVLNGTRVPIVPELGSRNDGISVLYRGKEHSIASEPECGKTWWACLQVSDVLRGDGRVVFVDFEDDEETVVGRLLDLGVLASRLGVDADQFRYVRPEGPLLLGVLDALFAFEDGPADLVVYDGVTEGMSLLGLKVADGQQMDAAKWRQLLIKPALRVGAATLSTDHVVKSKEGRGRYAIGDQHKLAGLNGVQFLMEQGEPFGRGLKGRSRVLVSKDRNGALRQHGKLTNAPGVTHLGDLVGDATSGEMASLVFWPPFEDEDDPERMTKKDALDHLGEAIVEYLETVTGRTYGSQALLEDALRARGTRLRKADLGAALQRLEDAGRLERQPHHARNPRPGTLTDLPGSHSEDFGLA